MARDPQERPEVAELIRRIEHSRAGVDRNLRRLKQAVDVPSRVRQSILDRPFAWFGGSMGAGLLASRLFRRRPKRKLKKSKGLPKLLFATLVALAKPALKNLVLRELQRRFGPDRRSSRRDSETHLSLSKDQPAASNS